jgi:hypothetical protein
MFYFYYNSFKDLQIYKCQQWYVYYISKTTNTDIL